ncbi:hypothetical protein D3C76_728180 [compost metagenome]
MPAIARMACSYKGHPDRRVENGEAFSAVAPRKAVDKRSVVHPTPRDTSRRCEDSCPTNASVRDGTRHHLVHPDEEPRAACADHRA